MEDANDSETDTNMDAKDSNEDHSQVRTRVLRLRGRLYLRVRLYLGLIGFPAYFINFLSLIVI